MRRPYDADPRPPPGAAVDHQLAVIGLDQPLADRRPQPRSAIKPCRAVALADLHRAPLGERWTTMRQDPETTHSTAVGIAQTRIQIKRPRPLFELRQIVEQCLCRCEIGGREP